MKRCGVILPVSRRVSPDQVRECVEERKEPQTLGDLIRKPSPAPLGLKVIARHPNDRALETDRRNEVAD